MEKEYLRIKTDLCYAVNKIEGHGFIAPKKKLNAELSFHYSFPFIHHVFLMAAAGLYGEDSYNIYFNDKCGYLRFKIATGFIRNKITN